MVWFVILICVFCFDLDDDRNQNLDCCQVFSLCCKGIGQYVYFCVFEWNDFEFVGDIMGYKEIG